MAKRLCVVLTAIVLMGGRMPAQQFPPGYVDPLPLLAAASKEIGEANLKCITYSGTGYDGAVGQTFEQAVNVDWPRIDSMANYTRTINWEPARAKKRSTETWAQSGVMEYGLVVVYGMPLQKTSVKHTSSTARTRGIGRRMRRQWRAAEDAERVPVRPVVESPTGS